MRVCETMVYTVGVGAFAELIDSSGVDEGSELDLPEPNDAVKLESNEFTSEDTTELGSAGEAEDTVLCAVARGKDAIPEDDSACLRTRSSSDSAMNFHETRLSESRV